MTEDLRLIVVALLVPVVWALLQCYIVQPVHQWIQKKWPPAVADFLTKRR